MRELSEVLELSDVELETKITELLDVAVDEENYTSSIDLVTTITQSRFTENDPFTDAYFYFLSQKINSGETLSNKEIALSLHNVSARIRSECLCLALLTEKDLADEESE